MCLCIALYKLLLFFRDKRRKIHDESYYSMLIKRNDNANEVHNKDNRNTRHTIEILSRKVDP